LGGGGIGNIIDSSAENSLIKFKKRVLAHQAVDRFQFRQEANRALNTVDPITYADLIDPSKVLMINARFDHVIRIEHVLALWEAIGRPELVFVP
ncbi:MAG: hypothetical protein GTO53_10695, partial [Planctomycetales bacterium]|nr:hypothetical protein [Planctomycetales bacterium]NIN09077.1 hypothetical protein [Planctomycetales bacterium]NIN78187.1 hypothetical protein [Planctomycetales bacterium]NIP05255.1 hypothetical protein [Planctomycetales bacterium]NIP70506.1 hypothetical protein [Planctomycetales bacterium]